MIRISNFSTAHSIAIALAEKESLSGNNLELARTEFAKERYSGKTNGQCLAIFHDPTVVEKHGYRNTPWKEAEAWIKVRYRAIGFGEWPLPNSEIKTKWTEHPELKGKWLQKLSFVLSAYGDEESFNIRTSTTWPAMTSEAVLDGAITQEELDTFEAKYATIEYVSPAEDAIGETFATTFVLEVSDVALARS